VMCQMVVDFLQYSFLPKKFAVNLFEKHHLLEYFVVGGYHGVGNFLVVGSYLPVGNYLAGYNFFLDNYLGVDNHLVVYLFCKDTLLVENY